MILSSKREKKRLYLPAPYDKKYLTRREAELMMLLHEGSYKKIANLLGISRRTVEAYACNMLAKFHCARRLDLIEIRDQLSLRDYIYKFLSTA